jgi:hypothetical protein
MIIHANNNFKGALDLSALERLAESNVLEKCPFRLSIKPGQNITVDDKWYTLRNIQSALKIGYISISNYQEQTTFPQEVPVVETYTANYHLTKVAIWNRSDYPQDAFIKYNADMDRIDALLANATGGSGTGGTGPIGPTGPPGPGTGPTGATGPSGLCSYLDQSFVDETVITVIHYFGVRPVVEVIDVYGAMVVPLSIIHNSLDDFTVTFSNVTSGYILATAGSPSAVTGPTGNTGPTGANSLVTGPTGPIAANTSLSLAPSPSETGAKGTMGYYSNYLYYWREDNTVVRFSVETSW